MKENKLIAEFMGGIPSSVPNLINLPQTIGESSIFCVRGSEELPSGTYKVERINELEYHSSWDWLMPVVEKIYQLGLDNESALLVRDSVAEANLDSTYQAVVEFINQLNN